MNRSPKILSSWLPPPIASSICVLCRWMIRILVTVRCIMRSIPIAEILKTFVSLFSCSKLSRFIYALCSFAHFICANCTSFPFRFVQGANSIRQLSLLYYIYPQSPTRSLFKSGLPPAGCFCFWGFSYKKRSAVSRRRFWGLFWLIPGTGTGNQEGISCHTPLIRARRGNKDSGLRAAGHDSGLCPENPRPFEKGRRKLP